MHSYKPSHREVLCGTEERTGKVKGGMEFGEPVANLRLKHRLVISNLRLV